MTTTYRLTSTSFTSIESRRSLLPRVASRRHKSGVRTRAADGTTGGTNPSEASTSASVPQLGDLGVTPSPSRRRASATRAQHRRGAISAEWGSGEFDESLLDFANAVERDAADAKSPIKAKESRVASVDSSSDNSDTELVMVLERRGEGWAEEVFPHVAMRRRPVATASASKLSTRAVKPNSAELYLTQNLNLTSDEAASLVSAAAAWRVTRGGRALVDRKIMRAVQANAGNAVETLLQLGASKKDIPELLRNVPQILAVVPTDEWNRNFLEYIVRTKIEGGGRFGPIKTPKRLPAQKSIKQAESNIESRLLSNLNLEKRVMRSNEILNASRNSTLMDSTASQSYSNIGLVVSSVESTRRVRSGSDPLKPWVEDVRDKRQCGFLTQEQMYLLDIAGFDVNVKDGPESNRTLEMWFDELVEYKTQVGSCEVPKNRSNAGLGRWVERQRVKFQQGNLPEKVLLRLYSLGVDFDGYTPSAEALSNAYQKNLSKKAKMRKPKADPKTLKTPKAAAVAMLNAEMAAKNISDKETSTSVLSRETLSMIASLKEFQHEHGEFAEPPLGSELAVWLASVRARAESVVDTDDVAVATDASVKAEAKTKTKTKSTKAVTVKTSTSSSPNTVNTMTVAEHDALVDANVELENFSLVWLGELEKFASLKAHRVTLHDPKAHALFVRNERAAANAGLLSHARLMRLRHVGMSGITGALLLDKCELVMMEEVVQESLDKQSGETHSSSFETAFDGSDFGSLSLKTVAALPLRENVLAAEAARAAREEAKANESNDRRVPMGKPPARARARPVPVDAGKAKHAPRLKRRPAGGDVDSPDAISEAYESPETASDALVAQMKESAGVSARAE